MIPIPCFRCRGSGQLTIWTNIPDKPGQQSLEPCPCPDCLGERILFRREPHKSDCKGCPDCKGITWRGPGD